MRDLPRGTVTFLLTDIEGSTRLLTELGDRYAELLAEHRRMIRGILARFGGVEVDTEGDAFFAAFSRARDALAAAEASQRALADGAVRIRIGMHTGEPTVTSEGYVGLDVHRTARICAAAHGGQVVLSQTTRDLVANAFDLRDLGRHRLKDVGDMWLYQLGHGRFPPLRTLTQTNLPIPPTPLVGREQELAEVLALLRREDVRLVTLTGPGGTGKTRLALEAAAELVGEYEHGVWWVALGALTDPRLVLPTIAAVLGTKEDLFGHVADRRLILVLDNLEQLVAGAPDIAELLAASRTLNVLATSREALRLSAEHVYAVPVLRDAEAALLFRVRAEAARPDFEADADVARICRRLEGLPLAIELAAARVKLLSPLAILNRLEQRLPLLTGGTRDLPQRQRTLRATIDWSYQLLGADEGRLFARLALFAGGFTLESAEAVCDADLDKVQSLVDKSLISVERERFVMLETIREYALEKLEQAGGAEELRRRHAKYFARLGGTAWAGVKRDDPAHWLELIDSEIENIRAAFAHGMVHDRPLALGLASALERFWIGRGMLREGSRWLEQALEDEPPGRLRIRGLHALGSLSLQMHDNARTRAIAEERLALARSLGDRAAEASALNGLAASFADDEPARAEALYEEGIALARASDPPNVPTYLSNLALTLTNRGDLERAAELLGEALSEERRRGNVWSLSLRLSVFGNLLFQRGEIDRSLGALQEGLVLCSAYNRTARDVYYRLIARAVAARGDAERATRLLGAADAVAEEVGRGTPREDEIHSAIRAALGSERFDALFAEGRGLSDAETIALALEGTDPRKT